MLERVKQVFLNKRDIVFLDQEGELVRLSVDEDTHIERLIQERESLGERVVIITDASEAKKLIEKQQQKQQGLSDKLFLGRS